MQIQELNSHKVHKAQQLVSGTNLSDENLLSNSKFVVDVVSLTEEDLINFYRLEVLKILNYRVFLIFPVVNQKDNIN